MQSSPQYSVELSEDRRREVFQTIQLQQQARPLLEHPATSGSQLDTLVARAQVYLEAPSPTPFREALVHLKQRLEAARRGESPPPLLPNIEPPEPTPEAPEQAAVGKPAPQFVAGDLTRPGASISLRNLRGRPVLMIFYNPQSHSLDEVMMFAEGLKARYRDIALVGVVMSASGDRVNEQLRQKGWKMPVLNGTRLRLSYGVDYTPRLVLIDADGVIQGMVTGWGSESAAEVQSAQKRWLGQ
jgi:hypothetical protein